MIGASTAGIPGLHNGFEYPVLDFKGGLNTKSSTQLLGRETPYSLRPDQYTDTVNLMRNESGYAVGRFGFSKLNSVAVTPGMGSQRVSSIYEYRPTNGLKEILATAGNTFYVFDGSNTLTASGAYPSSDTTFHWAQMNDLAIGVNGADFPYQYDGTAFTQLPNAPFGASVVARYRNHLFMIRDLTLFYSAVGTTTDWTTPGDAGQLPIPSRRGTKGTALLAFYDRLIVWTDREVFALLGTDEPSFRFDAVSYEYGHQGRPDGIATAGNDVLFFDQQGVHRLSVTLAEGELGNLEERYASGVIEPTWQGFGVGSLPNGTAVDMSNESRVVFLRGTSGQFNDVAVVADYYHRDPIGNPTWDYWDNQNFQCAAEVESLSTNAKDILFGGRDGFLYRRGGNTDDGTSFRQVLTYTTDAGRPEMEKLFRWIKPYVTDIDDAVSVTEPFTITFRCDNATPGMAKTPNISVQNQPVLDSTFILDTSVLYAQTLLFPQVSLPCVATYLDVVFSFQGTTRLELRGFFLYGGHRRILH